MRMLGSKSTGGFGIADTCGFTISLSHSLLIAGADTKQMAALWRRTHSSVVQWVETSLTMQMGQEGGRLLVRI